jgi:hypothetical protein
MMSAAKYQLVYCTPARDAAVWLHGQDMVCFCFLAVIATAATATIFCSTAMTHQWKQSFSIDVLLGAREVATEATVQLPLPARTLGPVTTMMIDSSSFFSNNNNKRIRYTHDLLPMIYFLLAIKTVKTTRTGR